MKSLLGYTSRGYCARFLYVRRWQVRMEPLYHRLFHGLYLIRDIAEFPKSTTYCWWGTAIPHAR
jgi:hypothetical protein